MNKLLSIGAVLVLTGCLRIEIVDTVDPVITASEYVGLQERTDRAEIRQLIGVDPVRVEWCAAFVNAILELDGIPSLNDQGHPTPLMARSFLTWGKRIDRADIRRGDVVVFPRGRAGWQGHVGFYVDTVIIDGETYWRILGGNQDQSVSYDYYNPNRALDVRRYSVIGLT